MLSRGLSCENAVSTPYFRIALKKEHAMRRASTLVLLALAATGLRAAADKGAVVDLDGLKSAAPSSWKEEAPANQMRLAQFSLPKAKGDANDAEIVIFKALGGSAADNVARWKGQFTPPEGKAIDDVSKVTQIKIAGRDATQLDVHGTYLYKKRPFDPNEKGEQRPDYRLIGIQFAGPDNVYHIRLLGPAKTVEHYKEGFDEWLKNFK
jgi:hypothetical protein